MYRRHLQIFFFLTVLVSGCGDPAGITYESNTFTAVVGTPVNVPAPTVTFVISPSFTVSPPLPGGLTFGSSGEISGTPTESAAAAEYTVSVTSGLTGKVAATAKFNFEIEKWSQEAYLKAPNTDTLDQFGYSAAVSGDTVVVGTGLEDSNQTTITNGATASGDNSAANSGAVYVFKRSGTSWAHEAYLKAPNGEAGDTFGDSVAISGDTIVVGVPNEDSNQTTITNGATASSNNAAANSGAVYVFKRSGTSWAQEAYLKAPNAEAGDRFGWSVAVNGDTIAVGALYEDSNQTSITNGTSASGDNSETDSGAVYIFKRTGVTWAQEAYVKASNAEAADSFGASVAVDADTLVVGAPLEDSGQKTITNGTTASSDNARLGAGAVYVYKRTGSTWAQEAYLKAPNAEIENNLGSAVAISGDTIIAGASGENSNQTTITNGPTASSNESAIKAGAAFVFKRTGTQWAQEAYLKASNAEADDYYGLVVGLSGDTAVVGTYREGSDQTTITNGDTSSSVNAGTWAWAGAAYVYKRAGTTWRQEAYLKPPNLDLGDQFGYTVGVSGDTIVAGSRFEDSNQATITNGRSASTTNFGDNNGAAYVFKLSSD